LIDPSFSFRDRGGLEVQGLGALHGNVLVVDLGLGLAPDNLRSEAEHGLGLLLNLVHLILRIHQLRFMEGGLLLGVREVLIGRV